MVVVVKIPSHLHESFFHCNVNLHVSSFNCEPKWVYPLRVIELVVDARCGLPLLEKLDFSLKDDRMDGGWYT